MRAKRWMAPVLAGGLVFWVQFAGAAALREDFTGDPLAQGWRVFGDAQLFQWNSAEQDLRVTWDSSQSNTYFYHSLGTILARDDDFSITFDLRLDDIGPGANTNKSGAFELAIGLLNLSEATRTNFFRGTGTDSPDLVEFDYFRDAGFGATIWPTFISTNSSYNYNGSSDFTLLALAPGDWYHILMQYTASNSTLTTTMTQNGVFFGPINSVPLNTNFTDFRVDTFALCSYNDTGDDFDSLLAHGVVDNLVVTTPPPPLSSVSGGWVAGQWQVQFRGRTNWLYSLDRTIDLENWTSASSPIRGTGGAQALQDILPRATNACYRVRAQRP